MTACRTRLLKASKAPVKGFPLWGVRQGLKQQRPLTASASFTACVTGEWQAFQGGGVMTAIWTLLPDPDPLSASQGPSVMESGVGRWQQRPLMAPASSQRS